MRKRRRRLSRFNPQLRLELRPEVKERKHSAYRISISQKSTYLIIIVDGKEIV